jgi:hypothetical protein
MAFRRVTRLVIIQYLSCGLASGSLSNWLMRTRAQHSASKLSVLWSTCPRSVVTFEASTCLTKNPFSTRYLTKVRPNADVSSKPKTNVVSGCKYFFARLRNLANSLGADPIVISPNFSWKQFKKTRVCVSLWESHPT